MTGEQHRPQEPYADEQRLADALRRGDEEAFVWLQSRYQQMMLRVAYVYVSNWATAEDVVQDTWLSVFQTIDRFEGRSSLKTWIFHILMNKARTRAKREQRVTSFPMMWEEETEVTGSGVDPAWFDSTNAHWTSFPNPWPTTPEGELLSAEIQALILQTVKQLPTNQMEVITLRDLEGFTPHEVSELMELTDVNQRVLLHRARSKVRRALEQYFEER